MAKKRPSYHRYTREERKQAVSRLDGETQHKICTDLQISAQTFHKWRDEFKDEAIVPADKPIPKPNVGTIKDFVSRVRSVLWGIDQNQYEHWLTRVEFFQDTAGYTLSEAQVRAAKEFHACRPFFREYDIRQFDKEPGSHPDILFFGDEKRERQVVCRDEPLTYREALRWAVSAAGMHLRTGQEIYDVPNDMAYYLYQQALADPKDFITKLGTSENREDSDDILERNTRKFSERAVSEIDRWLNEIEKKADTNATANEITAKLFFETAPSVDEAKRQDAPGN